LGVIGSCLGGLVGEPVWLHLLEGGDVEPAAAATPVVVEGVQLEVVEERGGVDLHELRIPEFARCRHQVRRRSAVVVFAGPCGCRWVAAELVDPLGDEGVPHTKFCDAVGHVHFIPSTRRIAWGR
jgi:hypothetical protein